MGNIVAIVGRPNVGKSTLFNRLIEEREAIMHNESGVTRDRHYGQVLWNGKQFTVIDTGGYVVGSEDIFEKAIRGQVELALEEAAVVLFLVDCISGLTPSDKDFANILRRTEKPVLLVANKADSVEKMQMAATFYALGLESEVYPISSANGSGTGDLLDALVKNLPELEENTLQDIPRISVVGRPNVGKSSFVNLLLNQQRSIVTAQAGTTRDAIDTHYKSYGKNFILTDTAGIRKKSRVKENIEFYSVLRAIKSIEKSDVCILILDAQKDLEAQDLNILQLALRHKKGVVIMVNKWDLVEKDSNTARMFEKRIAEKIPFANYIPIVFASVLAKKRPMRVIEKAMAVVEERQKKIPTSALNDLMLPEIQKNPPPSYKGKYIKIKYITQLPVYTPSFAFFCNHPKYIKPPYVRFLENKLRQHFGFEGVPIGVFLRKK